MSKKTKQAIIFAVDFKEKKMYRKIDLNKNLDSVDLAILDRFYAWNKLNLAS